MPPISNNYQEAYARAIAEFDDYDDTTKRRKILFLLGADATCEFENDQFIRVNKTVLALQSKFFMNAFFGSNQTTNVLISEFKPDAFQTFLDCLFGLKDYSVPDALVIYPIARKYEVEKSIKRCISVLKPEKMNENVCLTLNLAVEHECEELVADVMDFLENKVGIVNLLENDEYCSFLQPKAMCKLIEKINFSSYFWGIIYDWAKNYWDNPEDHSAICLFLKENRIWEKFSSSHFESIQSIFDFHKKSNKKLIGTDEIFDFLEENLKKKSDEKLPEKSVWTDVKNGDVIKEILVFKNSYCASSEDAKNGLLLEISTNRLDVKNPENKDSNIVQYKVRYFGRNMSPDIAIKQLTDGKDEKIIAVPSKATFSFGASTISPVSERRVFHRGGRATATTTSLKKSCSGAFEFSVQEYSFPSAWSRDPGMKPPDHSSSLFGGFSVDEPKSKDCEKEDPSKALVPCDKANSISSQSEDQLDQLAPTFSFNTVYAVAEKSNSNMKKLLASIQPPKTFLEIKSVEITYTFFGDCKILKTSINDCFDNSEQLYFTNNVNCSPKL